MTTTIFPVYQDGTIHAAFLLDAWEDVWATQCGQPVRIPAMVEHRVEEVGCERCADNLHRAAAAREALRRPPNQTSV